MKILNVADFSLWFFFCYSKMLHELCLHILSPKSTESIKSFVLPALVELPSFPFCQLLEILQTYPNSYLSQGSTDNVHSTGMLFSILTLDKKHFCKSFFPFNVCAVSVN